ncbi:MAG: DUF4004 family protein [Turicibacter sp.]|nr:DUF4004 family protein [Turicibacter sp.]
MEVELISKKELLQLTNISYGQLYRWKRKNLIPEDWFIKKSVSTGQETFFPREQMLERIEKIIELKDQVSLDELADIFSPKVEETRFEGDELLEKKIVTQQGLMLFASMTGNDVDLSDLKQVLMIKILDEQVVTGNITFDEGKLIWEFLNQHYHKLTKEQASIILMRHLGLPFVIGTLNREMVIFNEDDKLILEIKVMEEIGKINLSMLT